MAIVNRQFNTAQEVTDYLNDILLTKPLPYRVYGLDGLTLELDSGGAKTVTFADVAGEGLTIMEMLDQINAVVASLATSRNYGHMTAPPQCQIAFVLDGATVKDDGTANPVLGLSETADVVIGANKIAKTDIVALVSEAHGARYTIFHE